MSGKKKPPLTIIYKGPRTCCYGVSTYPGFHCYRHHQCWPQLSQPSLWWFGRHFRGSQCHPRMVRGKEYRFRIHAVRVQTCLCHPSCVTLNNLLNLSVPQFAHLWKGWYGTYHRLLWALNELIYGKYQAQCLVPYRLYNFTIITIRLEIQKSRKCVCFSYYY